MFKTLGDMFRPGNLPQQPDVRKKKSAEPPKQAEDYYTWACTLCGHPCAGPKNSAHVCKSCEDAAKNILSGNVDEDDVEREHLPAKILK